MDARPSRTLIEELLAQASWLRSFARSVVGDDVEAEDVAQEAWVAALAHRPTFESSLRPWLATVVRNFATERRRARKSAALDPAVAEPVEPADELVARTELSARVARAVLALGEPARSTVLWRYAEGLSSAEIARRTNTSPATVRSRLKRALDELRAALRDDELARAERGARGRWLAALAWRFDEWSPILKGVFAMQGAWKLTIVPAAVVALAWVGLDRWAIDEAELEAPEPATEVVATAPDPEMSEVAGAAPEHDAERVALAPPPASPAAPWRARVVDRATGEPVPYYGVELRRGERRERLRANAEGEWVSNEDWSAGGVHLVLYDALLDRELLGWSFGQAGTCEVADVEFDPTAEPATYEVEVGPTYRLQVTGVPKLEPDDWLAAIVDRETSFYPSTRRDSSAPVQRDDRGLWVRLPVVSRLAYLLEPSPPWALEVRTRDETRYGRALVSTLEGTTEPVHVHLESRGALRVAALYEPVTPDAEVYDLDLQVRAEADPRARILGRRDFEPTRRTWEYVDLAPGAYSLVLSGLRIASERRSVVAQPGRWTELELASARLPSVGSISGHVTSRTGTFDRDVDVRIRGIDSNRGYAPSSGPSWIDTKGGMKAAFRFDALPAGDYVVHVDAHGTQLGWEASERIVSAPADGVVFTLQDDVETESFAFRAVDARTGEPFERFGFAMADDWDDVPSLWGVLEQHVVRDVDPDSRLLWAVSALGRRTVFGTRDELVPYVEGDASTLNVIELDEGWTGRIRTRTSDGAPLADVDVRIDGRVVGRTDRDGLLTVERPAWPESIEVHKDGWDTYDPVRHEPREHPFGTQLWIRASLHPE